jgi:hypothetical protein
MSQNPEPESKGWWQTLPGLLTAAAGIITAVAGLLVAIHQTGFFDRSPHPPTQAQSPSSTADTSRQAGPQMAPVPGAGEDARALPLPADTQIRFEQYAYQLLSARVEPYAPGKVSLHLTVRMTNNGAYDANFWAASFRLVVDGSLQAPADNLDELVSSHSTKESDLEFVIPANISTVALQMGDVGEGKPAIPIALR